MKLRSLAAVLLWFWTAAALAQSSPSLYSGQIPTAAQWNGYFAAKQDYLGFAPVNRGGDTLTGRLNLSTSTTSGAGLNLGSGVAPTSPINGDVWITTAGLFTQANGQTLGPFMVGGNNLSEIANVATARTNLGLSSLATLSTVNLASNTTGLLSVANGGTGISSGTSGGILGYTAAGTIASSGALTSHAIILGGGAGVLPTALGSLGTATTVLHGNASGAPSFGAVNLGTDVTGTLGVANGGTGLTAGTSGGVPYYSASGTIASSGALTANGLVLGGGAGAAPVSLASLGTTTTVLHGNAVGAPSYGALNLGTDTSGLLSGSSGGTGNSTYAVGDILYASGTSTLTRLPIGANGSTLTVVSGLPSYQPPSAAIAVPVRQTVLSGPQSAGLPSFLPATTASLAITSQNVSTGANSLVVASSGGFGVNGQVDTVGVSTSNLTWSSLTASNTNFLGVTVASGALTPFTTTLQPIYQYGGTISTTSGQYTFDIVQMKMFLGNGTVANQVQAVFVGEAVASGSAVTSTVAYAYQGIYDSGFIATLPGTATQTIKNANLGIADGVNVTVTLRNLTTEGNYSANDNLPNNLISPASGILSPLPIGFTRNSAWFTTGAVQAFSGINKTTGVNFVLTLANWAYRVYVRRAW